MDTKTYDGKFVIFSPCPGAQSHGEENPGFFHFLLIQLHIMILQLRVLQQRKIDCKQKWKIDDDFRFSYQFVQYQCKFANFMIGGKT